MFDYQTKTDKVGQEIWSLTTLQPLAPGALTPFSSSVLMELINRGWYEHYAALGFDPRPRSQVVRMHAGRPYFNLTLAARLEAEQADVPPAQFVINGRRTPVCTWEKSGFLGGLRAGRAQKRMENRITELNAAYPDILVRVRNWYAKTGDLKWTQADILQVMEEIERIGVQSFAAFLAARRSLEQAYNRLLVLTGDQIALPENLARINQALPTGDLVETRMIAELSAQSEADLSSWLAEFGHRAAGEGELQNPRWDEEPDLLRRLRTHYATTARDAASPPSSIDEQVLLTAAGKGRKEAAALLTSMESALTLQSRALNAVAYILAGTRRWALAAAREAISDRRLVDSTEIFFYELEEIKQMMTGEWNISAMEEIRATAAKRREVYAGHLALMPGDLLAGDAEAFSVVAGAPAGRGQASGPFRSVIGLDAELEPGTIVGIAEPDSGWSLLLPLVNGVIGAYGTPVDPLAAAARSAAVPMLTGFGSGYAELKVGDTVTLE